MLIKESCTRGTPGHIQPKKVFQDATFPYWSSPCKQNKISMTFSRNIDNRRILNFDLRRAFLTLMIISMQKIEGIDWFLPQIMIIKEYCNLIGWEYFIPKLNQIFPRKAVFKESKWTLLCTIFYVTKTHVIEYWNTQVCCSCFWWCWVYKLQSWCKYTELVSPQVKPEPVAVYKKALYASCLTS